MRDFSRFLLVAAATFQLGCAASTSSPADACKDDPPPRPTSVSATASPSSVAAIPYDLPRPEEIATPPPEPPPGVPRSLARARTSEEVPLAAVIDLLADGRLSFDGNAVSTDEEVLRLAREALARDPSVRAVIRADTNVAWGAVVHAIDLLKQAGINRLAFGVSPVSR